MLSFPKSARRALLAGCLTTSFASCATSNDPGKVAVQPTLPTMPRDLQQPCRDPGVDEDAIIALTENRAALIECKRQHRDTVLFFDDVKRRLEGTP